MASHIKYLSISILLFVFLLSSMRVVVHAEEHSVEYEGATYTYSDAGILISAENAIGAVDLAALAKDNNITLKVIGKNAFTYGNNITSVNIPASVMIIDEYAFSDCGNLTKLTYEGQSQLTSIGLGAFSLDYAFSEFYQADAEDGGKFNFPEGLTTISGYAFQSTTPKEVIIPEKCGQIGDNAFESDSAFSVIIYNNNIVIGDGAFPGTTIIYANPGSSAAQYAGDKAAEKVENQASRQMPVIVQGKLRRLRKNVTIKETIKTIKVPVNKLEKKPRLIKLLMPKTCRMMMGKNLLRLILRLEKNIQWGIWYIR